MSELSEFKSITKRFPKLGNNTFLRKFSIPRQTMCLPVPFRQAIRHLIALRFPMSHATFLPTAFVFMCSMASTSMKKSFAISFTALL